MWLLFHFLLYPNESYLCWTEKENAPKTINDVKLINGGKILENNKTLAESRLPIGELPGGVITMHIVIRPPASEKNTGNSQSTFYICIYAG